MRQPKYQSEVQKITPEGLRVIITTPGVRQRRHIDCSNLATLYHWIEKQTPEFREDLRKIPAYKRTNLSGDYFLVVDEATEVKYRLEMKT